jgi:MFS transporter, putative metabolite:H+ symporter
MSIRQTVGGAQNVVTPHRVIASSSGFAENRRPGGQQGGSARALGLLDRMDRLPGWPLPPLDLAVLGVAYFFVFYDITDIGFGMPAIAQQFHLSSNDVKFVAIAIGLIGYIVGSNLIGALADWRGRRIAFLTSLVVSGVGSLGCAVATGVVTLSIWRFLTGMGVGAALNLASTYVGELSPASQRGRISCLGTTRIRHGRLRCGSALAAR